MTAQVTIAHLYGGPLDGNDIEVEANRPSHADQETQAIYTYCPHATRRLGRTTFIHQDIDHAALAD